MEKKKLSIVIPSYKDPLLHKTIDDLLDKSELGDLLEVIVVLDNYWPEKAIREDARIKIIHLGTNRGPREAINVGIKISSGQFFMRLDEHCAFGQGYDRIMTDSCGPNQIMTARRYFLNPETWQVMPEEGYIDIERLTIQDCGGGVRKFAGQKWRSLSKKLEKEPISESFATQGSMWIMPREWFDKVCGGRLESEGYGPAYQDSTEVCMKTWRAGGKLVVNKDTWFAHKHRSFSRTHSEGTKANPWKKQDSWAYALMVWEHYYLTDILPRMNVS